MCGSMVLAPLLFRGLRLYIVRVIGNEGCESGDGDGCETLSHCDEKPEELCNKGSV